MAIFDCTMPENLMDTTDQMIERSNARPSIPLGIFLRIKTSAEFSNVRFHF